MAPIEDDPRVRRAAALHYLSNPHVTVRGLAVMFKVRPAVVAAWLGAELVPVRRDRRVDGFSDADVTMVRRLAVAGWSAEQVMSLFDVGKETLRRELYLAGIRFKDLWPPPTPLSRRAGPRLNPRRDAAVERFKEGGVTAGWLAAEFEVSRDTVMSWLRAAGLDASVELPER